MWVTREALIKALKAEGFEHRGMYWKKMLDDEFFICAEVKHILLKFEKHCPTREDLPRFLLQEERNERDFGNKAWHQGVKSVVTRIMNGG